MLVGKPVVDFLSIRVNWTFFAIYYGSEVMMRNVYSLVVFTRRRLDLFALKFYLDRVVPINHSWHQKTRDTGLPGSEGRIPLRPVVLTQYQSVTDGRKDRRTDGRICRSIYCACKASFAARCKRDCTIH